MKNKRYTSLPVQLVEDIKSLGLSKINTNHAIHLVDLIKNKSYREYRLNDMAVPLPYNYLIKVFTSSYKKNFLQALLDNNIIICSNYYSKDNSVCLNYNINSIYTYTNISYYTYMSVDFDETSVNSDFEYYQNAFSEDIQTLNIDANSLYDIMNEKISHLSINSFNINEQIEEAFFEIIEKKGNNVLKYNITLEAAIVKANASGRVVLQDKTQYYLVDANEFIANKKDSMIDSYRTSIHKLTNNYLFANRNATNNRLDTNITNMCGELVDQLCEDNDLVQIDLSNSQFAILAHVMKADSNVNTKADYIRFKTLCEEGQLYTHLQSELGLNSRKTAKKLMFHLAFSKRSNSKHYAKLKALFPTVTTWISEYKKANGSNMFAVMLQKEEAKMFIDNIWHDIKEQGYFCLTKHDSVIVRKEQLEGVQEIISIYFKSIDFTANIEVSSEEEIVKSNTEYLQEFFAKRSQSSLSMRGYVGGGNIKEKEYLNTIVH